MAEGMDPNLLQDFLTESTELIQQLDADLVTLETLGGGPEGQDRLNSVFRALHTIKGAASFLGLTTVTHFAHAAEDALNHLRKGDVRITPVIMDALLKSVDVVRRMIEQLAAGETVDPGPEDLIAVLLQVAQTRATAAPAAATPVEQAASAPAPAAAAESSASASAGEFLLHLPPQKVDLLQFMAEDLRQQSQKLDQALHQASNHEARVQASKALWDIAAELSKTAEFFELPCLTTITGLLARSANALQTMTVDVAQDLLPRLEAIRHLIDLQTAALERSMELRWPLTLFVQRMEILLSGNLLPAEACTQSSEPEAVLQLDGVLGQQPVAAAPAPSADAGGSAAPAPALKLVHPDTHEPADAPAPGAAAPARSSAPQPTEARTSAPAPGVEQTIRVEVGRLEALLNLVGQLVLTKNRVLAIGRKCRDHDLPIDFIENIAGAAGDLDRLTSELQVGVMRTRMQPLAKLFERYPRVIRDIARALNKKINLEITGKDTEVDKSVLELLADPLVHILRNAADHGIESPEIRAQTRKGETGTIHLRAEHQGSHVRVEIRDDGKGMDREVLARKAVEKGMVTAEEAAALTNEEVYRFIFAAGFSTADKVTDLSGRGVGMDVVRTNIAKLNGAVNVYSTKGQGTTIEILIPLTVAIMPAMVVGVGSAPYCIPLQSIIEIVKPEKSMVYTVSGQPVMRLRDSVLPLVDLRRRLSETGVEQQRFAVVIGVGGQRVGLLVDRLIGQQEVVIKPLDDKYTAGGPFSGATIREDGDVCLILDVIQLIRQAPAPERLAA